ncbi:FYN-binding protein 1 isoform X2 [Parambassis ranga]|uniref:FYN-binding protein 1 isoform X2 n=1 Tax=Parambassis ranga TaxID=210632 RepID=A0A6P7I4W6_9TELE|nr:FYN-binding protein 1-like isoform X2 [Parambassis ranga]
MGENVDVKALRAKFTNNTSSLDTSSRDSGSPKSPRPGFGRVILPIDSELAHKLSPTVPPSSLAGPGLVRLPTPEPAATSRSAPFPRPPPSSGARGPILPADINKVKQTGELLQNIMLSHQRPPGLSKLAPAPGPSSTPLPLRQPPRQRSAGDVTPLRRPLPPEGPLPVKPKRPPTVNLEPFLRFKRGQAFAAPKKSHVPADRNVPLPGVVSPPKPPQRFNKPNRLPRQIASVDLEDDQDPYDDIGSFDKNETLSDNSSQCVDGDADDVYEFIDEDQVEINRVTAQKINKREAQRQQEQEKKQQMERQKRQKELKKNFQLEGEIEVIHTARARYDWYGEDKLDLRVRQGDSVDILRLNNNPGGKWLARSQDGNYGYISNVCVDIDYEAVKFKALQSRRADLSALPPPPPDPPQMVHNMVFNNRHSFAEDDDDYDDVQPITEDFPPPPPEISLDPKVEKELRKKFKYEGPVRVLHTMMVNPNGTIKKPGGKDLAVIQGEVLDVIQHTSSKKALCRNSFGKYGYVSRSLLLPMEGDIYDDVDYSCDVYDNDSPHNDY